MATTFTGAPQAHVTDYLSKLLRETEPFTVELRQFVRPENAWGYGVGQTYNLPREALIDPLTTDIYGISETTKGKLYPLTNDYQAVTIKRLKFGINTTWEVIERSMHENPRRVTDKARKVLDLGLNKIILKLMKTTYNHVIPDETVTNKLYLEQAAAVTKVANTQFGWADLESLHRIMWETLRIPTTTLSDGSQGYNLYASASFFEPLKNDSRFIHWNKAGYPEKMFHSSIGIASSFECIESNLVTTKAAADAAEKLVTDTGANNIPEALAFGADPVAECLAKREVISAGWSDPPYNEDFVAAVKMLVGYDIPFGNDSVTPGEVRVVHVHSA